MLIDILITATVFHSGNVEYDTTLAMQLTIYLINAQGNTAQLREQ